jgi:membrane-associated phospholipid phosphatase
VALFVLASTAVQCLVGTPGGTILAAVALMLPVGVLTYFANRICKLLWPKQRRNLLYDELVSGWVRGSFPSFHSQFGATLGTTFSTAVVLLGPAQGKLQAGALAVLTMALPLALVAWSRLYLGVHDIVDIFGGVLIGASLGATWAGIAIALAWVPAGAFAWTQVAGLAVFVFGLGSWERHRRHSPSVGQWGIRLASRAQWRITDR